MNADTFYNERDARAGLELPLASLPPRRVAIVVPHDVVAANIGVEIALFWTASIIRRMGRAFSEIILVTSSEFRQSESCLPGNTGLSVEQVISNELRSADPFGRFDWRSGTGGSNLGDAAAIVWLGTLPLGTREAKIVAINAHGWVALVHEPPYTDLSLSPPDFEAAPAAIIMAVCMAAARIFSNAFTTRQWSHELAFALDTGTVTCDPGMCGAWLATGGTLPAPPPWRGDNGSVPSLRQLLIVSAGGIGGNFCTILRDSYFHAASAFVVDPDNFEISNLNRAVGVGISHVGASKAGIAADSLRLRADNILAAQCPYESWITAEYAEQFRQPGTAVVLGLDQVRTRLVVGSDWPWMLFNGATSGSTFSTSLHMSIDGGCIGCWYGQDDASFIRTRTPMACVAGVSAGSMEFRPTAGYPFVSVAAACQLVAMLARAIHVGEQRTEYPGTLVSMSLRAPECAQVRRIPISERCLLLCSADYVQNSLQRGTDRGTM